MTTIPQRLRDIAKHIHECGLTMDSRRLKGIAAELEAPAADAVPVVAYEFEHTRGHRTLHPAAEVGVAYRDTAKAVHALVNQRDHLATVSALQGRITSLEADLAHAQARINDLEHQKEIDAEQGNVSVAHYASVLRQLSDAQARINELEARQWFLSDETDDAQDDVWSDAAYAYAKAAGCLRGHLEWRDRIRAAVRVLIASVPHPDTSKEQP